LLLPGGSRHNIRKEVPNWKVVELISKSAAGTDATKTPMRNEKWWASLAEEDWNLIKLSGELGPATETSLKASGENELATRGYLP